MHLVYVVDAVSCSYLSIDLYVSSHIYLSINLSVSMFIHSYTHTHTHIYIYIYKFIYIYIYTFPGSASYLLKVMSICAKQRCELLLIDNRPDGNLIYPIK